jgi:hypothetical protein
MPKRIAVIQGNQVVGSVAQSNAGARGKVSSHIRPSSSTTGQQPIIIKLPRNTVEACGRSNKTSLSFSHEDDINGRPAVIYATGDNKGFRIAYKGEIAPASHSGLRQFVLINTTRISKAAWEKEYAPNRLAAE